MCSPRADAVHLSCGSARGMAEGGEAGAPPVRLWVRRVGVYCDEHRKTWLVAAEEASVCVRFRASPWLF